MCIIIHNIHTCIPTHMYTSYIYTPTHTLTLLTHIGLGMVTSGTLLPSAWRIQSMFLASRTKSNSLPIQMYSVKAYNRSYIVHIQYIVSTAQHSIAHRVSKHGGVRWSIFSVKYIIYYIRKHMEQIYIQYSQSKQIAFIIHTLQYNMCTYITHDYTYLFLQFYNSRQ